MHNTWLINVYMLNIETSHGQLTVLLFNINGWI